jgi:hypothetical protein
MPLGQTAAPPVSQGKKYVLRALALNGTAYGVVLTSLAVATWAWFSVDPPGVWPWRRPSPLKAATIALLPIGGFAAGRQAKYWATRQLTAQGEV